MDNYLKCLGYIHTHIWYICIYRVQWLRGRAPDFRLREPGFESCAAVLKPGASFFTLQCSSSLSCLNEYLTIDSGGYVYKQPSHINCSIWLDASQGSRDGVWVNRSVREVKCKALYMYIYVYIYIYTYTHIYTCIYIHTCVYIYIWDKT